MKYMTLRHQAYSGKLTAKPYTVPEWDDDPMGVYIFEPVATELGELYSTLEPDEDMFEFDERVHEPNIATALLLAHRYNLFDLLLLELGRIFNAHALGRTMTDIDWDGIRHAINLAYEVQE